LKTEAVALSLIAAVALAGAVAAAERLVHPGDWWRRPGPWIVRGDPIRLAVRRRIAEGRWIPSPLLIGAFSVVQLAVSIVVIAAAMLRLVDEL
jgi:hypothetical protein